ncbi:hypothetical protein PCASD_22097 [Puccinia coronata f. sp. avenae]|uniref:Uncharacterized protein n=1 Tax=Puccinia coronata f. sp. avenae TaxID=200324 RepID=A0A2N5SI23_9BASI|nr:hypothetical protein PCASD_22097 [Puccinia coronata f. sp. avenae]
MVLSFARKAQVGNAALISSPTYYFSPPSTIPNISIPYPRNHLSRHHLFSFSSRPVVIALIRTPPASSSSDKGSFILSFYLRERKLKKMGLLDSLSVSPSGAGGTLIGGHRADQQGLDRIGRRQA